MVLLRRFPPSPGPFSRIFSAVVFVLLIGVAFFFGVFLFLVIVGLAAIAAAVFYLRFWWLRRRWARRPPAGPATLEGEYTVEKPARQRRGNRG